MKTWIRTAALTTLTLVVLAVGAGLVVLYGGAYNVAATEPHTGIARWALETLQHNSVAERAAEVEGALPTDSAALAHGFQHFHAMCVQCHGAPGFDRGELGQGIRPVPPRLEQAASEWSDQELFWITKHGIRLAGMPAFGPTHSDEALWGIVAFVRQLEQMTEEEYAERVRAMRQASAAANGEGAGGAEGAGGHSHAPGTPAHDH